MQEKRRTGITGERVAEAFLRRRRLRIVNRNVENAHGEIDLVATHDGIRIAIEVRSRVGEDPLVAFDWAKIDRVHRTASALDPPIHRVDLVTVEFGSEAAAVRWIADV